MNADRRDMQLILTWARGQSWFKTKLAEWEDQKALDNQIASEMAVKEVAWKGRSPQEVLDIQEKVKAEVIAKIEAEVE